MTKQTLCPKRFSPGLRSLSWSLILSGWLTAMASYAQTSTQPGQTYAASSPNTPSAAVPLATPASQPSSLAVTPSAPAAPVPTGGFAETLTSKKTPRKGKNRGSFSLFKNADNSPATEIEMFAGESRVFPAPGVARIAVGNGQIMSAAALDNKEVLVFANAAGTSSLFVWNSDGRYQRVKIHIVPGETSRFAREVAAFLSAIPNAKTSIIGDKVVVEGDHLSDLDLSKIEELAKRYPQIVNFTNRLGWEQMVLLDVKVVEFPTKELREIGLRWNATGGGAVGGIWSPGRRGSDGPYQINVQSGNPPAITSPGGEAAPLPSSLNVLSALNMGLNAQLNLLAQEGKAAILAEPQLSARNGAKASFLAGGEYPYTVSTVNGQTVLFKPYGIKLDIQPRVDRNGVIRATIESEVSAIDASISTLAGPALRARKTNTEFNVQNGQTIVLAGLLSRDSYQSMDSVPGMGNIPVLGALFRSKRYQNDETELVVFVTPTVIDSHTPEMVQRVTQATERLQKHAGTTPALLPQIAPQPVLPAPVPVPAAPSVQAVAVTSPAQIQPASLSSAPPVSTALPSAPSNAPAIAVTAPAASIPSTPTITPAASGQPAQPVAQETLPKTNEAASPLPKAPVKTTATKGKKLKNKARNKRALPEKTTVQATTVAPASVPAPVVTPSPETPPAPAPLAEPIAKSSFLTEQSN